MTSTEILVSGVPDFLALEGKWRDLETRADPSFFQSWTWTGCLAEERFSAPVLVEVRENSRTVALALFNRRGRALYLGESGDPAMDRVFIEFNGVLTESGREAELSRVCLRAARTAGGRVLRGPRLVLGGVDGESVASAIDTGAVLHVRSLPAPLVDLKVKTKCFLDTRSANTRQQLRRSSRDYAKIGEVATERAETFERAEEFLDALARLHQASWAARGKAGAFSDPFFKRFHRTLIARGLERGEIDLLRVSAGPEVIGFLYNFRYRGCSIAYQSGFNYAQAGRQAKPGMTCHLEAIRFAARTGAVRYDFLAGDDRYKRSLSDRAETLHWIEVTDPWSPRLLVLRAWERLRGRSPGAPVDQGEHSPRLD